ncbi:MAG: hypothetical protein LBS18_06170 [Clostridiales bacterium]|nr:hypothetical protein [Clostridiales bacterium]
MEKENYETNDRPKRFVERRRSKDWVTKAVPIFSVIGWLASLVMLVFLDRAKPPSSDFFSRYFGAQLRTEWNVSLLRTALITLITVFCFCVFGFLFNAARHRRKTDKYNKSILILGIISLAGIIAFVLVFGNML